MLKSISRIDSASFSFLVKTLSVIFFYFTLGKLGLLLAVPPGYATAIFPSAGVALAALILYGTKLLPGVFLGSLILNVFVGFESGLRFQSTQSILIATSIAFGASLQTWFAFRIIKRYVSNPRVLSSNKDLFVFFVIAGPLSCLINPSIGVASLFLAGSIPLNGVFLSWWNWWIGDAIGSMVVAPIIIVLFNNEPDGLRERVRQVVLPTLLALSISIVFFILTSQWQEQRVRRNFKELVSGTTAFIKQNADSYLEILHSIEEVYRVKGELSIEEFHSLADAYRKRSSSVLAISWNPRIKKSEISKFEKAVRKKGTYPQFHIRNFKNDLDSGSDYYLVSFPIFYISPRYESGSVVGIDAYSEPRRHEAIDRAVETEKPQLTQPISLVQDNEKNLGLLVYQAVKTSTSKDVLGVLAAVFNIKDFFQINHYGPARENLNVSIFSEDHRAQDTPIFKMIEEGADKVRAKRGLFDIQIRDIVELEIAGQTYKIAFSPTKKFLMHQISWSSYGALLAGLFFCCMLLAFLLSITGKNTEVKNLVIEKTQDILELNHALTRRTSEIEALTKKLGIYLNLAPAGIFETDRLGRALYMNQALLDFIGLPRRPARSLRNWIVCLHADDREIVLQEASSAFQKERALSLEFRFISRGSGKETWVSCYGAPQKDLNGEFKGYLVVAFEINRIKEAENQLRSMNQIFQNAVDGIASIDLNGYYTYTNEAYASQSGYIQSEMIGMHWSRTVHQEDLIIANETYQKMLQVGKASAEYRGVRKDGSVFDKEVIVVAEYSLQNQIIGHHCFLRDITARNNIRRELSRAKEAAEAGNRAKSEFLAMMSHEIRTPLNGVVGFINLLEETELTPTQRDYVENAERSSDMLLNVINDVLDFSKIEAGKLNLENIEFSLGDLLSLIKNLFMHQAESRGLKFKVINEVEGPDYFVGDVARIKQVLANLVSNALKFTQKGSVTLRVFFSDKEFQALHFEVADTGIGIPSEALSRIFNSFTQVESPSSRRFGGTGLGLSISRKLVHLMNGEIGVRSEEGHGSSFWFYVPEQRGMKSRASEEMRDIKAVLEEKKTGRILVAEDIQINQKVILGYLEKLGHRASAVANGYEVLDALRAIPYDLILMDCQMPDLSGLEATRIIRSGNVIENSSIPIIALTAAAVTGDREKCLEAGMDAYLTKPVNLTSLDDVLQKWLPLSRHDGKKKLEDSLDIDRRRLASLRSVNNVDLLPVLIDMFIEKIPSQIIELEKMIRKKDFRNAEKVAHASKSAAANLGATRLSKEFSEIEIEINQSGMASLAHMTNLRSSFEAAKRELVDELTVYKDKEKMR